MNTIKFYTIVGVMLSTVLLAGCGLLGESRNTNQPPTNIGDTTGQKKSANMGDDKKDILAASPRHQEWVEIDNNGEVIYSWVVYPEVKEKAPVVVVIHENKGLTDWVRQMADDIAAEGYIAIAPDLLSNFSPDKKRTSDFATEDEATQALYTLDADDVMNDIQVVTKYATNLDAANGRVASVGFCRGGSQSFRYASVDPSLDKAFVFYGTAPEESTIYENIDVPVIAFYGGDDERVNATIDQTQDFMDENNNPYTYEIYDGAGHAFMRKAVLEDASQADIEARASAFARMLEELKDLEMPLDTGAADASLVDIVVATQEVSILKDIVVALDLVDTLNSEGPFTVFAPTNEAFEQLLEDLDMTFDELAADAELLRTVVLYHVVAAEVPASAVMGLTEGTLVETVGGESVRISNWDGVKVDMSNVIATDIMASNGVIHLIDEVLLPPSVREALGLATDRGEENIVATAIANGSFPTLIAAVQAAGLVETLSSEGPFTVYAPTEEAFTDLLADLDMTAEELLADTELLTKVLTYHVVPGFYTAEDIVGLDMPIESTTAQGSTVTIDPNDGSPMINDSAIIATDVYASNGVIHVIDKVLVPSM